AERLAAAVGNLKQSLAQAPKDIATRAASELALDGLTAALPEMIGGSADLTGSNNTRAKTMKVLKAPDYSGTFIHYGVREHGMAAAMNGMALHGGVIPYLGTFLVFSDYCRPAIPPRGTNGPARHFRHDARLHRAWRGRPNPSARRTSRRVACDPQIEGVSPLRRGRNRRMLAACFAIQRWAERAGADAANGPAIARQL